MLSRLVNDEPCKSMIDDCVIEVELDSLITPLGLKAASSTDVTLTQVRHFIQNGEKSMKPTQPIPWPEKPWQHIQIDIFGEVQAAPNNKKCLVVVYKVHSKWPEIAATAR